MAHTTFLLATIVLAATIAVAHSASIRVARQAIPREFQNVNIENYLKNPRAVQFQLKCVIYNGPCDRIGKYLKITIPELLTNQCRNCNPEQKKSAGRLVAFIQQNYPKEWDDAVKKFQGGKVVSADEVKRFEDQFGIKGVGIVTEPSAEGYTGPPTPSTTTARVTIEEIGQIVKEAKKDLENQQKNKSN